MAARQEGGVGGLSVEAAHHFARIYAAARAGCLAELRRAGCSESDAEDIFATTLERIMRKFDPAYGPAQTVALLKKACLQKLIDERRHRDVLRMVPLEEASARAEEDAGPAQAVQKREAVAIAREAIASLPERDRALFFQRHQLGLAPKEIQRRNPGLSERTYRKVIGRANARALRAFEEIQSGERCAQIGGERLRRFATGEGSEEELASVDRHLRHCRSCRAETARVRSHLHDVASGLAAVLAIEFAEEGFLVGHVAALWGDAVDRAQALGAGLRAARERLREMALKAATALPGSGGEAAAGQVAGVSAVKVTSACAAGAMAVGCIAAGVLPGFGALERGARHRAPDPPAKHRHSFPAPSAMAAPPESSPSSATAKPAASASGGAKSKRRADVAAKAHPSSPRASSRPSARTVESAPPVASDFGAEADGAGMPLEPRAGESSGGAARSSAGAKVSRARGTGARSGGASIDSPEFGF